MNLERSSMILFCALAAERLNSVFKKFAIKYSFPIFYYEGLIEFCFEQSSKSAEDSKPMVERLLEELEPKIPDTEDYSDVLADQAQCAFICTYYCLSDIHDSSQEAANYAIQKVFEAVGIFGYEGGNTGDVARSKGEWQDHLIERLKKWFHCQPVT